LQFLLPLIKVWVLSYSSSWILISKRWPFTTCLKILLSLVHSKMFFTFTFQRFSEVNNQYLLRITSDFFGYFILLVLVVVVVVVLYQQVSSKRTCTGCQFLLNNRYWICCSSQYHSLI